jgi:glycosyltransferase involved in cell wall biosynthesis
MPPLRIVFVHYDIPVDVGGVSTWIRALVPDLRRLGFDARVHICNSDDRPGPNTLHFESLGVPVRWAKAPRTMLACVRQCIEWINLDRPDIYVSHCVMPSYYAGSYARGFGVQTIGVLHNDDDFTATVIKEFVAKDPSSRFSSVVAVSDFLRSKVNGLGIPNLMCHRIPCGVPVPEKTTRYDPGRFKIAYVGRLAEEQKQISKVTRALCESVARHPSVEAIIVGAGPDRGNVEQIIREHPHRNRVRLTGRLDNREVGELLQGVQALVLLSDYEGLPVSVLEAMAAGVVPICLKIRSGIAEVVQSGVNGFLVNDREEDFQAAVARLIAEPATWLACSEEARRTVEREFSMEACHRKWVFALTELAKQLPTVPRSYPIPLPTKVPAPHPDFHWRDDTFDRLFPFATPWRNSLGRWRRKLLHGRR